MQMLSYFVEGVDHLMRLTFSISSDVPFLVQLFRKYLFKKNIENVFC